MGELGLEARGVTSVGLCCCSKETGEIELVEPVGDMVKRDWFVWVVVFE